MDTPLWRLDVAGWPKVIFNAYKFTLYAIQCNQPPKEKNSQLIDNNKYFDALVVWQCFIVYFKQLGIACSIKN